MPIQTEYRFLTRDETLELGVWVDSSPSANEMRHFASREDLLAFAARLESEGWELISASTGHTAPAFAEIMPTETWVFRRAVGDE